jgi:hypothetical protein
VNTKNPGAQLIERAQKTGSSAATAKGAFRALVAKLKIMPDVFAMAKREKRTTTRAAWYAAQHKRRADARYEPMAAKQAKSLRLPTRDMLASCKRLPAGLTAAERASIQPMREAVTAWRARPLYVRAYFSTPNGVPDKERKLAEVHKGYMGESPICARYAEYNYAWGALRVHSPGKCVLPSSVGMRETGSNRDWTKRSTLDRKANYFLAYPRVEDRETKGAWTGYLVVPTAYRQPNKELVIKRSKHHICIPGMMRADVPITKGDGRRVWPAHIQRRILSIIAPAPISFSAVRTGGAKKAAISGALLADHAVSGMWLTSDAYTAREVREWLKTELNRALAHPARLSSDLYVLPSVDADMVTRHDATGAQTGVAVRRDYGWEHGVDRAECDRETARKTEIAAQRAREARATAKQQRRERLFARLATIPVRAEMVRAEGACMAGIESWCRAHGKSVGETVPLRTLASDNQARAYALRIAHRILASQVNA